jgi:hypothetical protein
VEEMGGRTNIKIKNEAEDEDAARAGNLCRLTHTSDLDLELELPALKRVLCAIQTLVRVGGLVGVLAIEVGEQEGLVQALTAVRAAWDAQTVGVASLQGVRSCSSCSNSLDESRVAVAIQTVPLVAASITSTLARQLRPPLPLLLQL